MRRNSYVGKTSRCLHLQGRFGAKDVTLLFPNFCGFAKKLRKPKRLPVILLLYESDILKGFTKAVKKVFFNNKLRTVTVDQNLLLKRLCGMMWFT